MGESDLPVRKKEERNSKSIDEILRDGESLGIQLGYIRETNYYVEINFRAGSFDKCTMACRIMGLKQNWTRVQEIINKYSQSVHIQEEVKELLENAKANLPRQVYKKIYGGRK
ncbi:MAG: hypothetical protein Q8L27_01040 [archaeon]|nr:hypothetical protein [archaeon]